MNPTVKELIFGIVSWLTPNPIKRWQIRPALRELNQLIELRNRAVSPSIDSIRDELILQNGPSLDRTRIAITAMLEQYRREATHWRTLIATRELAAERRKIIDQLIEQQERNILITEDLTKEMK